MKATSSFITVMLGIIAGTVPAVAEPLRILCLGDSITQGGGGSPGYRDPLIRTLRGENVNNANPSSTWYDVDFIGSLSTTHLNNPTNVSFPDSLAVEPLHEGHGAWRADQILDGHTSPPASTGSGKLANWLSSYTPDIVLLHLGTNDAGQHVSGSPDPNFEANTRNDLSGVIDVLKADNPDVLLFLAKLIPPSDPAFAAAVSTINGFIDALADEKNNASDLPYVFVVDHFTGFDTSTMLRDGLHPNAAGEAFMAVRWFNAIEPVLEVFATDQIPRTNWSLHYVDSQELIGANGAATRAFDGDPATHWHTEWFQTAPTHPHEIQINLGAMYSVNGFHYLPRQGTTSNGRVAQYEFYVSEDGVSWGTAVATGVFPNTTAEQQVLFPAKAGQYIRFRALSEVNGNVFTSVAELNALQGSGDPPANQAPNGVIDAPGSNVTITVGQSVSFAGTGSDPDNNTPLSYLWTFGTGSGIANSTAEDPGSVQFNNAGTFTVAFTVTDALGLADATPASRTITVQSASNQSPNGVIDTPASNVTITVGQSVSFSGTGTDPDNHTPLTYLWNFGAGSGIANATAEDPGSVQFNNAGTFTVSLTVTDALGLADSTPATRTIIVQSAGGTPTLIPRTNWTLHYVDSEETVGANGAATRAFDGIPSTHWHTEWFQSTPTHPHEIQINLGTTYSVAGFRYLPRQSGTNGRVAQYEFYVSADGVNWGAAVATGVFPNTTAEQQVLFSAKAGQYIRFRALSEVNGYVFTSVAELNALQGSGNPPANQAPNGVIDAPGSNVTITVGQSVSFAGTGSDPDNNTPLSYLWTFGTGSGIANSTAEDPGSVQFNNAGTFTVAFTVTDALGLADATPATRTITVQSASNQSPNGVIDTPASNVTITVGQSVSFSGTGSDPDNNTPLSYLWNFGAGSGIANSTAEDPGSVQFNNAGTFTVSFTVTDGLGLADSTPATRTITVQSAGGTPTLIPRTNWTLHYVDSEETVGANGAAIRAFDGAPSTHWHTEWFETTTSHPHDIQINLGATYPIRGFRYLPRQIGTNGRIAQYEFYVSEDAVNWGTAVATGVFPNTTAEQEVLFTAKIGQYIRLRALSEVNGYVFTSVAELNALQ